MTDEELRSTFDRVRIGLVQAAAAIDRCIADGDLDVMTVEARIAAPLLLLIDETDSAVDDKDRSILKLILDDLCEAGSHG